MILIKEKIIMITREIIKNGFANGIISSNKFSKNSIDKTEKKDYS